MVLRVPSSLCTLMGKMSMLRGGLNMLQGLHPRLPSTGRSPAHATRGVRVTPCIQGRECGVWWRLDRGWTGRSAHTSSTRTASSPSRGAASLGVNSRLGCSVPCAADVRYKAGLLYERGGGCDLTVVGGGSVSRRDEESGVGAAADCWPRQRGRRPAPVLRRNNRSLLIP